MRRGALYLLFAMLCAQVACAQGEERVIWSLQRAESAVMPLHQLVGLAEPSDATRTLTEWAGWEQAEALTCSSSSPSLRAGMVRESRRWTLALWNDGDQKTKVTLEGELPAGVYAVERVLLASDGTVSAVGRRNGLVQRSGGTLKRTEWLEKQTGMLLRFIETTHAIDETTAALRRSIWQSRTSQGVLSRLAALMRETDSHWYQARARLRRNDVRMAARNVHRMLFLVSGVRAVSSTYGLGEVARRAEQMIDALSNLSSALLNVVVTVKRSEQTLDVQVVNAGAQVWQALRLTPESKDEEAVVLAKVRPMERAEVSFRISGAQPAPAVVLSLLFNGGTARVKVGIEPVGSKEE